MKKIESLSLTFLITILALQGFTLCNESLSFVREFEKYRVYINDSIQFDLLDYVKGDHVGNFSIEGQGDTGNLTVLLTDTMTKDPVQSEAPAESCQRHVEVAQEGSYMMLCNNGTQIQMAVIDKQALKSEFVGPVNVSTQFSEQKIDRCYDLAASWERKVAVALCTEKVAKKGDTPNIWVLSLSLSTLKLRQSVKIDQQNLKDQKALTENLRITTFDNAYSPSFHIYTEDLFKLKDFGFYTLGLKNESEPLDTPRYLSKADFGLSDEVMKKFGETPVDSIQSDDFYFYAVLRSQDNAQLSLLACQYKNSKPSCFKKIQVIANDLDEPHELTIKTVSGVKRHGVLAMAAPSQLIIGELYNGLYVPLEINPISPSFSSIEDVQILGEKVYTKHMEGNDTKLGIFRLGIDTYETYDLNETSSDLFLDYYFYNQHIHLLFTMEGKKFNVRELADPQLFINLGHNQKEPIKNFTYTVTASSGKDSVSQNLTLTVLNDVHAGARINRMTKKVHGYAGDRIQLPAYEDDFLGNALTFEGEVEGANVHVDWVKSIPVMTEGLKNIEHITDMKFIGESTYAILNRAINDTVFFTNCDKLEVGNSIECDAGFNYTFTEKNQNQSTFEFLDIVANKDRIFILGASHLSGGNDPKVILAVISNLNGKLIKQQVFRGNAISQGVLELREGYVYAYLAGNKLEESESHIYHMKFEVTIKKKEEVELKRTNDLGHRICPSQLHFAPHQNLTLFLVSNCAGETDADRAIFHLDINDENPEELEVKDRYNLDVVENPQICVTDRHIHVADLEKGKAFYFDTGLGHYSRYYYQLDALEFDNLAYLECDGGNNLVQILALRGEEGVLVTLYGENPQLPEKRIHSVTTWPREDVRILASSYSAQTDTVITIGAGLNSNQLYGSIINYAGPHFFIEVSKLIAGDAMLTVTAKSWDGKMKELSKSTELVLEKPVLEGRLALKNDHRIALETEDTEQERTIVLKDVFNFEGPVFGIQIKSELGQDGFKFRDRLTHRSDIWQGFDNTTEWQGYRALHDYLMLWEVSSLKLVHGWGKEDRKELFSELSSKNMVQEGHLVERTNLKGEKIDVVGFVRSDNTESGEDYLEVVWSPQEDGKYVRNNVTIPEGWSGFSVAQVYPKKKAEDEETVEHHRNFLLVGYDNSDRPQVFFRGIKLGVDEDKPYMTISQSSPPLYTPSKITSFSASLVGHILIASCTLLGRGEAFIAAGRFEAAYSSASIVGSQVIRLLDEGEYVDDVESPVIHCEGEQTSRTAPAQLECVVGSTNQFSYTLEVTLNKWDEIRKKNSALVASHNITKTMYNVLGFEINSVLREGNYVAFQAKRRERLPTASLSMGLGDEERDDKILESDYVVIIYDLTAPNGAVHPFYVLTSADLERTEWDDLHDFSSQLEKLKIDDQDHHIIHFNTPKGIKTFALDSYALILKNYKKLSISHDMIQFRGIDNVVEEKLGKYFTSDFDPREDDGKDGKSLNFTWWEILIVALIALCFVVVLIFFIYSRSQSKTQDKDDDDIGTDQKVSIGDPTVQSESDYSKL